MGWWHPDKVWCHSYRVFFHCCIVQNIRYQPRKQHCFLQTACHFKSCLNAVCLSRSAVSHHEFFRIVVVLKNCPLTHQNKNGTKEPPSLLKAPSSCDQATSQSLQTTELLKQKNQTEAYYGGRKLFFITASLNMYNDPSVHFYREKATQHMLYLNTPKTVVLYEHFLFLCLSLCSDSSKGGWAQWEKKKKNMLAIFIKIFNEKCDTGEVSFNNNMLFSWILVLYILGLGIILLHF